MVRLCDLPKEIIEKIMLWAPADSVFQFKFVNKFWYSLISGLINNPEFVSKHLLITKNQSTTSLLFNLPSPHVDHRLITFPLLTITYNDDDDDDDDDDDGKKDHFIASTEACSVPLICNRLLNKTHEEDEDDDEDFSVILIPDARYKDMNQWREAYVCDGLILLVNKFWTMVLCNPALKEFMVLPRPYNNTFQSSLPAIVFGFDPVSNDYKCVAVWCSYEGLKVEVYTLGSNSWREINTHEDIWDDIQDEMTEVEELYDGLCWGGVCYWLVKDPSGEDDNMILSFNLSNEELQLFHVPDLEALGIECGYWLHLSVWNDSVMMCLTTENLIIHIFRMDEAEEDSCTEYDVKVGPIHNHHKVLPYWKNDEILMSIWKEDDMTNLKLVYCNIFTQEMRDVCDMDKSILDSSVCSYVKSLVSIRR
ncbi:F-box/kelch-repeat protein At3g06240 [Cannabis sativa]|uniref:F-box/kelch-repeat protein At3g06240 n=1 Tax=Cannabis sativa TaxID=3483 RepID=UPI0029CA6673|nr:F-box/kelch-repeat protein At3g06240 [Cannabis sativa]XP_030500282.2 F-box/kelch-repeat protein At3g06240 [Cannabis sativa]